MTARQVWLEGFRRLRRAPALLIGMWLVTIAVAVAPALALHAAIEDHLGSSLEADAAAAGANARWMQEFSSSGHTLAPTLGPGVIGFAAVLDNASALADGLPRPWIVVACGAVYLLLLTFLSSGLIDRLARDRPLHAYGFFAACGGLWFRMLRLTAISGVFYLAIFDRFQPWLLNSVYRSVTRDFTVERDAFVVRLAAYVVLLLVIGACSLIFDYARIRMVVEDRRSALASVAAGIRFVARHPGTTAAAYALNVGAVAVVIAAYAAAAPGAGRGGRTMWAAFAAGQAFIVSRLAVKLMFWSSGAALFQSQLAHAGFMRRPIPEWPDPPAI